MPDAIKALRTPDDRFADIPDFNYPVSYSEDLPGYEGLRAAWVDDGPKTSDRTFLCLHGEPAPPTHHRRRVRQVRRVESGFLSAPPTSHTFSRTLSILCPRDFGDFL